MRRRSKRLDLLLSTVDVASGEARRAAIETIHRECWVSVWGLGGRARVARRQLDGLFARLVSALETDDAEAVRYEAAYILSHWWEGRAARVLVRALRRTSEAARVRGQAAEGIGDLLGSDDRSRNREQAIAALSTALADSAAEVRFWAVRALGIMKVTELRSKLASLAREDSAHCPQMWTVKEEAMDALTYMETGTWPDR
jgi:HEAT repeat protein